MKTEMEVLEEFDSWWEGYEHSDIENKELPKVATRVAFIDAWRKATTPPDIDEPKLYLQEQVRFCAACQDHIARAIDRASKIVGIPPKKMETLVHLGRARYAIDAYLRKAEEDLREYISR